mgnify:CR=1 FL=1
MLASPLKVRFSEDQLKRLELEAEASGVKVSTYVRMTVLRSLANAEDTTEKKRSTPVDGGVVAPFNRTARGLGKRFAEIASTSDGVGTLGALGLSKDA